MRDRTADCIGIGYRDHDVRSAPGDAAARELPAPSKRATRCSDRGLRRLLRGSGSVRLSLWIPAPFHFEVGPWYGVLNLARNLTPGLFMVLCFTLFAVQRRFPLWLLALFIVQMFLEEPARLLVAPGWRFGYVLTQVTPTVLQMIFVGFAIYWAVVSWRADLVVVPCAAMPVNTLTLAWRRSRILTRQSFRSTCCTSRSSSSAPTISFR
jgi:hypothetical protein